jgi:polyisoprenoid-binding protein YceI
MKGIVNPIKLDVEFVGEMQDTRGNRRIGFYINGKLDRKNWNLSWSKLLDSGGVLVSDEIFIHCKFQLIQVE